MDTVERLKIYNQFIGYGDPNSSVWLMGVEEKRNAEDRWSDNDIVIYKNATFTFNNCIENSSKNSTYGGYIKLLEFLFPEFLLQHRFFITNLWPIQKNGSNRNFDIDTKEYFGFDRNWTNGDILNHIKVYRFFALEMFFKTFSWNKKIIFFCTGEYRSDLFMEFIRRITFDKNFKFSTKECKKVGWNKNYPGMFWLPHASGNHITEDVKQYLKIKIK